VHLAFFSGNEIYWKTRYEPSIDGSNTDYRTLVCYKEGTLGENQCGGKCDPLAGVWTGLWRDGCGYVPATDACAPENALSGQISWDGSTGAIQVPDTYKDARIWRNTSVATLASGQTATLGSQTLGYEWDWDQYPATRPPGLVQLSNTTLDGKVHHLTLYRAPSGALVFGAGTVQWSWGLDDVHDRGSDPPVLAMQQATVNLLAEMGVQAGALQSGLVAATASGDASPPASTIGFPLDGGSTPAGVTITVSGTAVDVGGGSVGGVEVSVDGGTTWAPATGTTSWTYAWTPQTAGAATVRARAVDDWGNLESPGAGISVTVTPAAPPTCPCTAWDASTAPAVADAGDGSANELGVRFRVDTDGFIQSIRFYKAGTNTGTHIGKLYSNTGTLLASGTFVGETASGWQQVDFATPYPVTAGVTYVASVWMPNGHYAFGDGFFATTGLDVPPIHLLQDGVDGANGIYNAGSQGFPTSTYQSSNYWVDVVFNTTGGPDLTPPTIVGISPGNGAGSVAVATNVTATFSEPMNPATITGTTFELRDAGNAPVPATVSYNVGAQAAVLTPSSPLLYSSTYTVEVTTGMEDANGNALTAGQTWSFTTTAPPPPPPTEGPGGPILVISSTSNPFSRYTVEILRAEGLNEFAAMDLTQVTPAVLADYDVVVLGNIPLGAADVTMLSDWTNAGGTLVALRPDPQLAGLLGLVAAGGSLSNGYLLVSTTSGPGVGIVGQTMQYHGTADFYTLDGATSVATLYSSASTATAYPAVTTHAVGSNGGHAIAFTYDLARSVVYTRQGNPAWAGQKRDGEIEPIRSDDQFFGNASFDPQPDWIDFSKIDIPQADEQQRLLANAILESNLHRKPLPRFWYLPKGLKAAIVMTGDNHGDYGMAPRFDIYRDQSPPGCSVDDWECVRATGYEYVGSGFTDAQALFYQNLGFEVALHVNTNCARATPSEYEGFVSSQLATFSAAFPSIPAPTSNRNHCIAWSDWSSVPEVETAHGIRFDTNYYYWPTGWVQDRPGFFTGSGIPMRFAKLDGTIIDCFQGVTQMPDESGESFPSFCDALLDKAIGPEGYYGVFTTNMHFDSSPHPGSDAVVASAQARGVPVVSAKQMLTWLDGRNGSSFGDLVWSGNQLSFSVAVGAGARNLRGMVPIQAAVGQLATLTLDGSPVAWTAQTVKGVDYAFFPADAGAYVATYLVDSTAPAISAVVATPQPPGQATITWTTDELSDSHVDYGTSPGSLTTTIGTSLSSTSHSVGLSGLAAGTTYYYRVRSADGSNNEAVSPEPPAPPASFDMPATPCAEDRLAADFAQGTPGASTLVTQSGDGELTLAPAVHADFSGASLPAGWGSAPWTAGGTATVSGGMLTVDGAAAYTTAAFGPGRSLEFTATFVADPFQNVGFAADAAFDSPWMTIGSGSAGNGVYARMWPSTEVSLGSGLLGGTHRYRIDWNAGDFTFYVDGVQAAVMSVAVGGTMVVIVSDFNLNGTPLVVDDVTLGPYASAGSFTSRVFDGGSGVAWGAATWSATTPAGTSVSMFQRQGTTPTPDGSWTAFTAIPSNGASIGGSGRYLQYRADLATTSGALTPVLDDVQFACTSVIDVTPPVISAVTATPGPSGTTATIDWLTDEFSTSSVLYGTSPGSLTLSASSSSMVVTHSLPLASLTPSTTYYFRVTSEDASSNSATEPQPPASPYSFTTPATPPSVCAQDQTVSDFSGGTLSGTAITTVADGEVALAPTVDVDFSGSALPAGWAPYDWPSDGTTGTVTVSGGLLTIDGERVNPDPFSTGPGSSLEFMASFSGDGFQHIGFGAGNQLPPNEVYNITPWIMFSTNAGGSVQARTHDGAVADDYAIPLSLTGAMHLYRIDWKAASVDFYVDGALVHTSALTVPGPMRPAASDLNAGGGTVVVDWMRMTPYVSSGTFTSRVHDAGSPVLWSALSWTATTPAGTGVALEVRRGDTPTPDGTWTAFAAVPTSGASIAGVSRYLQYRATLSTTDGTGTPSLADVSATCSACSGSSTAIADLGAAMQSAGGAGGRQPILITFSPPPGAVAVQVYRAPFGGYPRYDDAGGSLPATPSYPPGAPWTLTSVSASGQTDDPGVRDQWYYVAFWQDVCGLWSPVSNRPSGVLDYVLGDVSDGTTDCTGDNAVGTGDLSLLGAHYGATLTGAEGYACLDVGPTTDFSTTGRPTTDGQLEFEDLLMFALDYGTSGGGGAVVAAAPLAAKPAAAERDELRVDAPPLVRAGDTFTVTLRMSGAGGLRGVSVPLAWDPAVASPRQMLSGGFLEGQQGVVLSPRPGVVDGAVLGKRSSGIAGEGVLATFTFTALRDGDPAVSLGQVSARDLTNRAVTLGGVTAAPPQIPTVTAFEHVAPNPFPDRTSLVFALARESPVDLSIYSIDGRLVRTLVRDVLPAGRHVLEWDRRSGQGDRVGSGLYIVRLTTRDGRFTHKVSVVQ
jgi:hypothetical protein